MAGKSYNISFKQLRMAINLIKDHVDVFDDQYRCYHEEREEVFDNRVLGFDLLKPEYKMIIPVSFGAVSYVYNYDSGEVTDITISTLKGVSDPDLIVSELFEKVACNGYVLSDKADDNDIIVDTGHVVRCIRINELKPMYRRFMNTDSLESLDNLINKNNTERVTFTDNDVARVVLTNDLGRIEKSNKYQAIRYRYASTDSKDPSEINDNNFFKCFCMIMHK